MSSKEAAIVMEDLRLSYRDGKTSVAALAGISGRIAVGGITGLMGPDAAGKTTLMRILAGLLIPDGGKLAIFGLPVQRLKRDSPNSIGYMPQRFGLYEDLSVRDNLNLYASLRSVPESGKEAVFERLLKFTGLSAFQTRLAGNLSGGMKQKLGIACALLGDPELLLLDEPGVGVDPRSRRELWQMVSQLADQGMTVVWATSYLDEAANCPALLALDKGQLLFGGAPAELAARARGNVFELKKDTTAPGRRAELLDWTAKKGIIDVSITGGSVRLEIGGPDSAQALASISAVGGQPVKADLGDAYIAAIGGIDKRPSPYADIARIDGTAPGAKRIEANKLTKKFGDFVAAHDISFNVAAGEIVGLLGPNGAGKSTTFKMLCGLLRPTSGQCHVDGVDMLASSSLARCRLGYMAQKFSQYADLTVQENLYIAASLYGLSRKRFRDFGLGLADALDLGAYLKSRAGSLPLGVKQRLALLCATVHLPPVLFLDEPTSGVDLATRRDFWKHISALAKAGTAVLVTTHFLEEAEYCDNIALIYRGGMIKFGTPNELRAEAPGGEAATIEAAFIAYIDDYDKKVPV